MTRKFARFGGAAMAATLLVLTACNASDKTPASASGAKNWTEFRDNFLAGYFPLNPNFAVYQGKHEFDGKLPDWSPEGLNKQIAYELSVSEATIKAHVTAIFRKLGVRTRTQAALLLQQLESISSH